MTPEKLDSVILWFGFVALPAVALAALVFGIAFAIFEGIS